jgi:hypothetical protein
VSEPQPLRVSILIGEVSHAQAVVDDLRHRAAQASGRSARHLRVEALCIGTPLDGIPQDDDNAGVSWIQPAKPSLVVNRVGVLADKPGPLGIIARLMRDNLESRRVAGALARQRNLVALVRESDVVVAADPSADRAVWLLRRSSGAYLVHGPAAMSHAIRLLTEN